MLTTPRMRACATLLVAGVLAAGCTGRARTDDEADRAEVDEELVDEPGQIALDIVGRAAAPVVLDADTSRASGFPPGPTDVPTGSLGDAVVADLDEVVATFGTYVDLDVVRRLAAVEDARIMWPLAELLRFTQVRPEGTIVLDGVERLTGIALEPRTGVWAELTDLLLAWELPTPPGYLAFKAGLLTQLDPGWAPFLQDPEADVDWRQVAWGGVRRDDRPFGSTDRCDGSCIEALDLPLVTDAAGGDWYDDDRTVFAVVVGDEARAYPKHLMEAHELVNDEVGGVRIAVPYCTLCGSAQAYVTQDVAGAGPAPLVLRTSGLLNRSNKLMMDLATGSMFDTFSGRAISGPLRAAGVELEPITTLTTTWGAWKQAHPDTTIVAQDPGTGRGYSLDPLAGRDDDGPIFPVGDVDPRLPVQAVVVGVVLDDGTALAFDAVAAKEALADGRGVVIGDVSLVDDGGGLRAVVVGTTDVSELPTHESFWFAWSQRHPATRLWTTQR